MLVIPVLDPHDRGRIIGYFINGQIVDELPKIRKGLFGKSESVMISTDQAFIPGRGIVNLAAEREAELNKTRTQFEIKSRLDNDPFTRSLRGKP